MNTTAHVNAPGDSAPAAARENDGRTPFGLSAGTWEPLGRRGIAGLSLLLAAVVALVYWQVPGGELIYDDKLLVAKNPRLLSFGSALGAFFEPYWSFDPTATFTNAYWRPLTTLTLTLGRALSDQSTLGFHALSLALHFLACLAAWRLAARLLGSPALGFGVGLLFATHPVHVESVAWISAVNDPLNGLFALLALDAFVAWRARGSQGTPIATGVWFLLGLLAKEQTLAVLPILLALDLAFGSLGGRGREGPSEDPALDLLRSYAPVLGALLLYYVGRVVVFGSLLGGFDVLSAGFGLSAARALQFRVEIMGGFLEHLFVPRHLEVFRQVRPELPDAHAPWLRAIAFTCAWVALTGWAAIRRRRLELGMLLCLPAAFSLLLVRYEGAGAFPISDRYLYLPVVFVGVLIAALLRRLLPGRSVLAAMGVLTVAGGLMSHRYSGNFTNDEIFFRAAIASSPDNAYVRWGMGNILLENYKVLEEKEMLDEAAFHYLMSLKLGTDYGELEPRLEEHQTFAARADALSQLINGSRPEQRKPDLTVMWSVDDRLQANIGQGWCHLFRALSSPERDLEVAEVIFEQTLKRWPDSVQARLGYGTVLHQRGVLDEAERALREILVTNPGYPEAWHNLGVVLIDQRKWDQARNCFEEALKLRPGHLRDMIEVSKAAIDGGRFELARRSLDAAAQAHPESTEPIHFSGMLAATRGDLASALACFDQVLARQPDHGLATLQKGKVLAAQGDPARAAQALGRACELLPTSFEAYSNMASLLFATEGGEERARPYLRRAYELGPPDATRQVLHEALKALIGREFREALVLSRYDKNRRDYVHALDWADLALSIALSDPSCPPERVAGLSYDRGSYLWTLRRLDEAEAALRECLGVDPQHFSALHDIALILHPLPGRADEAAIHARAALELLEQTDHIQDAQHKGVVRQVLTSIAGGTTPPEVGPLPVPPPDSPAQGGR